MKNKLIPLAMAGFALAAAPAQADIIARYPFANASAASNDAEANSTAGDFTATVTTGVSTDMSISSAAGNAFARSAVITGTTVAEAVTYGNYFSFTVTPNSGQRFNLTSLTYTSIHNNTASQAGTVNATATMNFFVRSSVDGFAANVGSTFSQAYNTTTTGRTVDLSGVSFQNVTDPVTFRFYVFESVNVSSNQGARWDDVVLNGTLEAVPEPSGAAFALTITPNGANYDFTWPSQIGKFYDLVSSIDLATAPVTWAVWNGNSNIEGTGEAITLTNVPGSGPKRFFSVLEK